MANGVGHRQSLDPGKHLAICAVPKNTLNRTDLKTLRLVCKTWLLETNFLLYKEIAYNPCLPEDRAFHQFEIVDLKYYGLVEEYDAERVLVDVLAEDLLNHSSRVDSRRFPPIKLEITSFELVSSQTTLQFLTEYASWIVNLRLIDVVDGDSDPEFVRFPEYPVLPLVNLKTLVYGNALYGLPQLRQILMGATTLRSFELGAIRTPQPSWLGDNEDGLPVAVTANLVLPSTLQELRLRYDYIPIPNAEYTVADDVVAMMERNKLPNLKTFELSVGTGHLITSPHLRKMLTPVSGSLENLIVSGYKETTEPNHKIGLPRKGLRSLKQLTVGRPMRGDLACAWDLDESYPSQLGEHFPNLESINLYLTRTQFDQWIGSNTMFNKVKHVKIFLHEYAEIELEVGNEMIAITLPLYLGLSPDEIRATQGLFPNLVHLSVRLTIPNIEGLWYICSQMKNLESLDIIIVDLTKVRRREVGPFSLDAVLLGINPAEVEQVREFHKRGEVRQGPTFPGVYQLENLKSFAIKTTFNYKWEPLDEISLLSDASFHLGFLKMAELKNLELYSEFAKVSAASLNEWKNLKGTNVLMSEKEVIDYEVE